MAMSTKDVFVLIFGLVLGVLLSLLFLFGFFLSITTQNYSYDNDALLLNMSFLSIYATILLAVSVFFLAIAHYLKDNSSFLPPVK